jgi:carbamoyl-phosphate synthase large subunit
MSRGARDRVLVAGIGGASLGTEILKSLALAGTWDVLGCDVSPLAYGHYAGVARETFVVGRDGYAEEVLALSEREGVAAVIPGGDEPTVLLAAAADRFRAAGIVVVANDPAVVALASDKARCFARLATLGIPSPETVTVEDPTALEGRLAVPLPCVVKPATGTGGSRFVFLAGTREEARQYARYVLAHTRPVLLQAYVSHEEGEVTIGVLHLPGGRLVGSIALRRLFHAKLSVQLRTDTGLVSSGYSQGLIEEAPALCEQAERIAVALGSRGPLNVQGRVRSGVLLPFEVNPRFSASTHLRALAGFNEVDLLLRHLLRGEDPPRPTIRPGYYLRSLAETFVPVGEVKA